MRKRCQEIPDAPACCDVCHDGGLLIESEYDGVQYEVCCFVNCFLYDKFERPPEVRGDVIQDPK